MINYIEKLLKDVEVEWKPLAEMTKLSRGRVMSKEYLTENVGDYPVYSSQTANRGEIGRIKTFDYEGEAITWTTDGANAGTVFYRFGNFSITNVCGLIKINNLRELNYRFLFYWLSLEAKKYVYAGMGNPKLMSNQIAKIPIPIPPLEVQKEIVRILNTFTELTARKKQYEYYRNQLLSFKEGEVEWKTLGEISEIYGGLTGKNKSDFEDGNAFYIPSKNIFNNIEVDFDNLEKVRIAESEKQNLVKYGDVLFTASSEIANEVGMSAAITQDFKENIYINSFSFGLRFNDDVSILPEFSKYLFRSYPLRIAITKTASGVTRFNISKQRFKSILIPIPPLEVQKEIACILDKFDTLTTSISERLPKEIELRQKQYEYYRDMLLNFPRKAE